MLIRIALMGSILSIDLKHSGVAICDLVLDVETILYMANVSCLQHQILEIFSEI